MTPSFTVGLLWLVFGGTHVGLATRTVRGRLVARLGENGFTALYSVVAVASFVARGRHLRRAPRRRRAGRWRGWRFRTLLIGVVALG
jgi:hypothetical protein